MKAVLEALEGNKVKLSIEVDEQEFEKDIDAAFRKIAREVRVPGFRPGKAPRRILEARFGKETGRTEALRDAVPVYYTQAVRENEVDAIAAPELDIKSGEDSGPVSFEAVVEIRPEISVPGYGGLRVTIPGPTASEADIDAQVDRLRGNFGELIEVERPARAKDFVTINLSGTRDGQPVPQLDLEDFSYEVGSDSLLPGLDAILDGARVGDILDLDAELGEDSPTEVKVLVKEIKEKKLPDLTDEWASEASEFETVAELRRDIAQRMGLVKRVQATMALRNSTLEALVELVSDDPPAPLVDAEVERQLHDLQHRLDSQGASIEAYLEATGQDPAAFIDSLRQQAIPSVKADLALRAVAREEGIEATEDDIDAEVARLAAAYKIRPADARRNLERADQMPAVRSDWKKSRALDWLLEHVEIVDEEGNPVDRSLLEPDPQPADTEVAEPSEDDEDITSAAGTTTSAEESATKASQPTDLPEDEETEEP
jgi:trigger factor